MRAYDIAQDIILNVLGDLNRKEVQREGIYAHV